MGLKHKKAVAFLTDALIALLILLAVVGVLHSITQTNSEGLSTLLMKRHINTVLSMMDNENSLHQLLWMSEANGSAYIENELDSLIDERYDYNAQIIIGDNSYDIIHGESGDIVVVSKRIFVDIDVDEVRYGCIVVEVWQNEL